jgi:hypothetical protein
MTVLDKLIRKYFKSSERGYIRDIEKHLEDCYKDYFLIPIYDFQDFYKELAYICNCKITQTKNLTTKMFQYELIDTNLFFNYNIFFFKPSINNENLFNYCIKNYSCYKKDRVEKYFLQLHKGYILNTKSDITFDNYFEIILETFKKYNINLLQDTQLSTQNSNNAIKNNARIGQSKKDFFYKDYYNTTEYNDILMKLKLNPKEYLSCIKNNDYGYIYYLNTNMDFYKNEIYKQEGFKIISVEDIKQEQFKQKQEKEKQYEKECKEKQQQELEKRDQEQAEYLQKLYKNTNDRERIKNITSLIASQIQEKYSDQEIKDLINIVNKEKDCILFDRLNRALQNKLKTQ